MTDERLSSDEAAEIVRLAAERRAWTRRGPTVGDLAEALGRPEAEVRAEFDRVRDRTAPEGPPRPRVDRPRAPRAVWAALAVGTIALAAFARNGGAARLRTASTPPRPTFVERPEDRIHVVALDAPELPSGLSVRFRQGERVWEYGTSYGFQSNPISRSEMTDRLVRIVLAAGKTFSPGSLGFYVSPMGMMIPLSDYRTVVVPPGEPSDATSREVRRVAETYVADLAKQQNGPGYVDRNRKGWTFTLPPGVGATVTGRRENPLAETFTMLLPVDTARIRREMPRALARIAAVDHAGEWGDAPDVLRQRPERPGLREYVFRVRTWDGRAFERRLPPSLVARGEAPTADALRPLAREVARHLEAKNP